MTLKPSLQRIAGVKSALNAGVIQFKLRVVYPAHEAVAPELAVDVRPGDGGKVLAVAAGFTAPLTLDALHQIRLVCSVCGR